MVREKRPAINVRAPVMIGVFIVRAWEGDMSMTTYLINTNIKLASIVRDSDEKRARHASVSGISIVRVAAPRATLLVRRVTDSGIPIAFFAHSVKRLVIIVSAERSIVPIV